MVAARNGHLDCVKLLLGRGASLKLTTHRGGQEVTALQLAKKAGRTEVLHYLQKCLGESGCHVCISCCAMLLGCFVMMFDCFVTVFGCF